MQYYTFILDESSCDLCTFATPFALYCYCHLPMGVSELSDISIEIIHQVQDSIDDTELYLDNIGSFSNSRDEHHSLLQMVLSHLQLAINPLKCERAVQETDFLGHWLTPTGIKPWCKKVDAILSLQPPSNIKQLHSFWGMVNYYCNMWPHQTHVLAPLTAMTSKCAFNWDPNHQEAFDQMKSLVTTDALLSYSNHTKPFDVETDASEYHLGYIIKHLCYPMAYYSCKLNQAQCNYTTPLYHQNL